jgi:hypothetical protein
MSRFAKVNLLEVEDSVAGRVEGLEGHFGRKHLDSRDLGVSLFRYAPHLRSSTAHSHREQEEAYVVVPAPAGSCLMTRPRSYAFGMSFGWPRRSSARLRPVLRDLT